MKQACNWCSSQNSAFFSYGEYVQYMGHLRQAQWWWGFATPLAEVWHCQAVLLRHCTVWQLLTEILQHRVHARDDVSLCDWVNRGFRSVGNQSNEDEATYYRRLDSSCLQHISTMFFFKRQSTNMYCGLIFLNRSRLLSQLRIIESHECENYCECLKTSQWQS
jgi:hypothetical protein